MAKLKHREFKHKYSQGRDVGVRKESLEGDMNEDGATKARKIRCKILAADGRAARGMARRSVKTKCFMYVCERMMGNVTRVERTDILNAIN